MLRGGAGNDYLDGWIGKDSLFGDAGDDMITGRDSTIYGGAGNDVLFGGGSESDWFIVDDFPEPDLALWDKLNRASRFFGGDGDDVLYSYLPTETLHGDNGNDTIKADFGNDVLLGDAGNDKLFSGMDNNRLFGGEGNDLLNGGDDNDQLFGGAGRDLFQFRSADGNNPVGGERFDEPLGHDIIADFQRGQDKIEIFNAGTYERLNPFAYGGVKVEMVTLGGVTARSTVIDADPNDRESGGATVTVFGVTGLTASDFVLG